MGELAGYVYLQEFNSLAMGELLRGLMACCGSREWATQLAMARPFESVQHALDTSDRVWLSLGEVDWLEAFAAHPRIGEKSGSAVAEGEQAAALAAGDQVKQTFAELNGEYERRFGFLFIVFASGKSAEEMLQLLRRRLNNDRSTEIKNAAAEQMMIMRLRLQRLFDSKT